MCHLHALSCWLMVAGQLGQVGCLLTASTSAAGGTRRAESHDDSPAARFLRFNGCIVQPKTFHARSCAQP